MVWVLSFLQRVVRIKALDATVLSQYRSIHSGETIVSPIFLHAGQFTAKGVISSPPLAALQTAE
ncbi:hypothetical protein DNK69_11765 [Klebsiella pneumoniae]|nr:hypothetical protein D0897_05010 [Klebsiella pneumoniae]THL95215.1 hypothetical protein FAN16_14830 [Klebsiella pneumoniae subsp. pneumoniae]AYB65608.1 hypothetical protein D0898_10960 [Klebsiella pneumoniae]AYY33677.1 hypothetical protein EGX99_17005 [Klebsiella pneumoniae]EIW8474327.1 hypothetical protein [Klebsiella pneumoniae]